MKKFFIALLLVIVTLLGILPIGMGFVAEKVYNRFIEDCNRVLSLKGLEAIQIQKYELSYFKSHAVLIQKHKVGSGSGNATTIPMTLVVKDTIWHLPWLMNLGERQAELIRWGGWRDFELPLVFIQTDSIDMHFSSAGQLGSMPKTSGSEAVFTVADYITDPKAANGFFYRWFPWWPHTNQNAISNSLITIDANVETRWKMWFKHNILIGGLGNNTNKLEISDLSVFTNTALPLFSDTVSTALAQTEESIGFSLLRIPSSTNEGIHIKNFSHWGKVNPSSEDNFAEISTSAETIEIRKVFRVEGINFTQRIQKKQGNINLHLSNSAKQFRIEPQLISTEDKADQHDTVAQAASSTARAGQTYQSIICNLSLLHLPFSEQFIGMLNNKADPDYAENILKKVIENKPELILNQFTLGFPEGLLEIKGKLGFSDKADVLSLLRDPNGLLSLKKSLNGQFTIHIPQAQVDAFLTRQAKSLLVAEMAANTPMGVQLKAMSVADRKALLDKITLEARESLIAKKTLVVMPDNMYTLTFVLEAGQLWINGVPMPDQPGALFSFSNSTLSTVPARSTGPAAPTTPETTPVPSAPQPAQLQ